MGGLTQTQNIFIDFLAELDHTKKIILLWQFVFNQACNSDIKVKIQLLEQISASCVVYTLQCLNSRLIGFGIFFNLGLSLLGPWDLRWALPSGLGVHNSCRWGCKTQYIPPLGSVRIHIKTTATVWRCSVFHVLAVPGSSQGRRVKKETGIKLWHMIMLLMVSLIMVMLLNLLLLLLLELLNCWRLWWWYKRCRYFCYKWCWCCWFYYKCCWWCWCYYKCRLWCWCNCKCCW